MRETSCRVSERARASCPQEVISTRETGRMTRRMESESNNGLMETTTKETS